VSKCPRTVLTASAAIALAVAPTFVLVGCGAYRSFRQLHSDAAAVPVPRAVTFVKETQTVEDGPGFTSAKFEQVSRVYRNPLPCSGLVRAWSTALRQAGRKFRRWDYPHMFGAAGLFGITILDRPEHLGITIGNDYLGANQCPRPFIYAFNQPH
jgi:hypothetical protein